MKRKPETLNGIRKRKAMMMRIRPLLVLAILIPLVCLMLYPMAKMSPRDIHVGIVNLDKGAIFDQGEVNLGDRIVENILHPEEEETADEDDESPVVWTVYDTEAAAEEAMKRHQIFGYLSVPEDFTELQTAQLEAFDELSEALDKMSDGTEKMGSAVNKMGSKLGKMPTVFSKLEEATSKLGQAGEGLQKVNGAMGTEAAAITKAMQTVQQNQVTLYGGIGQAQAAVEELKEKEPSEITAEDLEKIQAILEEAGSVDSQEEFQTIGMNAAIIHAQSEKAGEALKGVTKAEKGMSENFGKMADNMGRVGQGPKKMSAALEKVSKGLGKMSSGMEDKVGDAIDSMNGVESEEDDDGESEDEETVSLIFVIDQSRNVMISSTLSSAIGNMAAKSGMSVDVEYRNEIPDELNNMYFAMFFMMLTMMTSMVPSILSGLTMRQAKTRKERAKTLVIQILLAAVIAVCLGWALPRAIGYISGTQLPLEQLSPFLCIATFCLQMLIIGAIDLMGLPGVAVPVLIMFLGMATGNLPYEFQPELWQKYIYPWEPLRFIADGVRSILYQGGNWWNEYAQSLLLLIPIGMVFMLLVFLKKNETEEAVTVHDIPE